MTTAKTNETEASRRPLGHSWSPWIAIAMLAAAAGWPPRAGTPGPAPPAALTRPAAPRPAALEAAQPVIDSDPLDWLFWRGPEYNGISRETGLVEDFDADGGEGSNIAWKREDLGGRSTPIVMDGKLYTIVRADPATDREGEKVVCVNAETGETIWENRFNVYLSDVPDTRVGWSSCVGDPETGSIYAQGVCGLFQCIDAKTGKTRWSVPLHERFGLLSTYGGRTNFPVICDDLVIVSGIVIGWGEMAKPAHRFLGLDKRTGEVVWFTGTRELPYDTTYSGPTLTVLNDQKALVFGSGDGGIWAFQPRTGKPIWQYQLSRRGVNAPPLVSGDTVFASHSEENMEGTSQGALVSIDSSKTDGQPGSDLTTSGENWRIDEVMSGRTQPLLVGDQIWVFDDRAKLQIFDAKTGEPVGRRIALGRMMRASPLYADGKVYAVSANGRWAIYEPDPEQGAKTVSQGRLPTGEECHASPICSHGRIYLQSTGALYCLHDPNKTAGVNPRPAPPAEPDAAQDQQPAHVQVVPAEVLMKPGDVQAFQVRLFNSRGQQLGTVADAEFTIAGPGHLSADGKFTAAKDAPHSATVVSAKVGSLTGTARIRVVPDLPWEFTFDDGSVPVTWVGARYRHVTIDDQLFEELKQENPLASQLYLYLASAFVNTGNPKQVYDNSTPQQKWSALQRFLGTAATNLEEAQAQLDPALTVLIDKGVLEGCAWVGTPQVGGIQLTVQEGPRAFSGHGVMTKITTIPKGTRSRCWFGQSDLTDYTIRANVRGSIKDNKMPDIGLIAQGYALDLQGASQKLQIRSWVPQLRMAETIDFPWQADRWYTMKLRASVEDGKAVLRGKVWPKDDPEPDAWSIEATDASPNLTGSPGLFGNAKDAEIFLDDITVSAN